MWKWLAEKLYEFLKPMFIQSVKDAVVELDKNKHYLLFLPNDVLVDMTFDEFKKELEPFVGEIDMLVLLTDEFHIVEF